MGYTILAVRSADEDDGRLYPVIGADRDPVEVDELDGDIQRVTGSGVEVKELVAGGWKTVGQFKGIKAEVLITESRLVVACDKYEKGGGWVGFGAGGLAVALAANGVSKARAARRRRGNMLVGHVRYAWLRCVGFKPKTGWASNEEVRLGVAVKTEDGTTRELFLDVTLPKNVDSSQVARVIVQRAARYRLAHTQIDADEERTQYEELANAPSLSAAAPKKFALYQLPRYFYVSTASALPMVANTPKAVEAS